MLRWFPLDSFCTQTEEAALEVQKVMDGISPLSIAAVINASYADSKTFNVCQVIPAHHTIVQGILNMQPETMKRIYNIVSNLPDTSTMKLAEVVSKKLNKQLLKLSVSEFKATVELLYFLKEYLLSLFGMGLVNLTCKDKMEVVLILSQVTMSCNMCDQPASNTTLFQCVECSVTSLCTDCLQTQQGEAFLENHSVSCGKMQRLLQPYIKSLRYAHLCKKCFVPLHRNVTKSHFHVICGRATCTVPKCKRNLCQQCLLLHK